MIASERNQPMIACIVFRLYFSHLSSSICSFRLYFSRLSSLTYFFPTLPSILLCLLVLVLLLSFISCFLHSMFLVLPILLSIFLNILRPPHLSHCLSLNWLEGINRLGCTLLANRSFYRSHHIMISAC